MAKNKYRKENYDITYSCGHEEKEYIGGYTQEYRDEQAEKMAKEICPACKREKAIKEAETNMEKYELPELVGTPRQVDWAMQIRDEKLDRIMNYEHQNFTDRDFDLRRRLKKDEKIKDQATIEEAKAMLLSETSSSFWIENKDAFISTLIIENMDKIFAREETNKVESKDQEIAEEQIIRPDNFNDDLVSINIKKEYISIESPKRQDIIDLVKSKGYRWRDSVWKKYVSSEDIDERAVEIGNLLLLKGYGVRFNADNSKELQEKAISGDYTPEQTRWVEYKDDRFYIKWYGYDDDLYQTSRQLPNSKWNSEEYAVTVPIINFNEILDFADFNGFKLTDKAEKVINELNSTESARETVKKPSKQANEIIDILNSSTEVLDDLKDED